MSNNEFKTIGLYDHNAYSYKIIKEAYESGKDVVGIVHATGTGKSYNALQLAYDNKDKKIVYIVPSNGIIEHIKKIIEDNPNLDMERDFPNLEFRTYQSFVSLDAEEIADIDCDLLFLDEFHHIGAPVWGARINTMIETHPNAKIFGMTAYTVRDRGTPYERDMANPDTDELFSGKIESRYDLCDAMIDGVLPKPIYKSAYINLIGLESKLEEKVQKLGATTREYQEYIAILSDAKRRIQEAPSIPDILRKSIKPNGKYIYFCPPCSEAGTNDIETIKKQAIEWFREFVPEEDMIIYTSTSDMGEDGKLNRNAFYDDITLDGEKVNNKLRVMFAINQYNEGIHAPNVDGVIMGRGTTSDIVYFEQLGRALSVRGKTKEMFEKFEEYTIDGLRAICKSRGIPFKENANKEDLIERLIAPVVIDLTNNYEFIKKLENNLRDRIKEVQTNGLGSHRDIKIRDASFDIEIENQDLFEMLKYISDRLITTWEDNYALAEAYYKEYHNLLIPSNFITNDGITRDEEGVALGEWIRTQRKNYSELSEERTRKLQEIGFVQNVLEAQWQRNYDLAKAYYNKHHNLLIPQDFITNDGVTCDEEGLALGEWISRQRRKYSGLSEERKRKLQEIGFIQNALEGQWQRNYALAEVYYNKHHNLLIPKDFITNDGVTRDEEGVALGVWISTQRIKYSELSEGKKRKLQEIGFIQNALEAQWQMNYALAEAYYNKHHNLLIPIKFITIDGITYDEDGVALGEWISRQRRNYSELSEERKRKLQEIGFVQNPFEAQWQMNYALAKAYYNKYHNLLIPKDFMTNDGATRDEEGVALGEWIRRQRREYSELSEGKKRKLQEIGFIQNALEAQWQMNYALAEAYYNKHHNLLIPIKFITIDGITYDENGVALGHWIAVQRRNYSELSEERKRKLQEIGMVWDNRLNKAKTKDICTQYMIDMNKNKEILSHISFEELQAKIDFLKTSGIPITNANGVLCDIFNMSSEDMKEKYGISMEELIRDYLNKNDIGRGV